VSPLVALKRKAYAAPFAMALILLAAGTQLVCFGHANPVAIVAVGPPPVGPEPPTILISSPSNATNVVSLSLNVSVGVAKTYRSLLIAEVSYKGDWQQDKTCIFKPNLGSLEFGTTVSPPFAWTVSLVDIPEGEHEITVYASELGTHDYPLIHEFWKNTSSVVVFNVDTAPPKISLVSPLNVTYTTPEVPLTFTVNEPTSWKGYSLDEQDPVFAANITLLALPVGSHTLTVYANDTAGNAATPQTVTFTVAEPEPSEPFPTVPVAVASGVSVIVTAAAALVYLRRRRH
jgi:hypothetical protein